MPFLMCLCVFLAQGVLLQSSVQVGFSVLALPRCAEIVTLASRCLNTKGLALLLHAPCARGLGASLSRRQPQIPRRWAYPHKQQASASADPAGDACHHKHAARVPGTLGCRAVPLALLGCAPIPMSRLSST